MANSALTDKPKIFISHAWEDKELARRLEVELKAAGADVWVDHEGVRGGDNLPERISDALDWCTTLLLVWSKTAHNSRWVKLEWTSAIYLEKTILPCLLDNTSIPALLASKVYVDFHTFDQGLALVLHALQLAKHPIISTSSNPAHQVVKENKVKREQAKELLVPVRIDRVTLDTTANRFVVILRDDINKLWLPIVVGSSEAQAIALQMENIIPPRPLTHDLGIALLNTLDAKIHRIIINDLRENTYYSLIATTCKGLTNEIDARPADAIALALRAQAPIYVANSVMQNAAVADTETAPEK